MKGGSRKGEGTLNRWKRKIYGKLLKGLTTLLSPHLIKDDENQYEYKFPEKKGQN